MNDFRYRELLDKERNKVITDLEKKELNLLREYEKIVDEQTREQVKNYENNIYQGAVDGDEESLIKLEAIRRDKESNADTAKLREEVTKEREKQAKDEAKRTDESTGTVKTGEQVEKEQKEDKGANK